MLEAFQTYWHADQAEPRFLIETRDPERRRRRGIAAAGGVLWQVVLVLAALNLPDSRGQWLPAPQVVIDARRVTPLIAPREMPPFRLTQKEAQTAKPAAEVDMAALLPRPEVRQQPQTPPGRPFVPPAGQPRPIVEMEAPKIEAAPTNLPAGPVASVQGAPPPAAPARLTNPFEKVGTPQAAAPAGQPKVAPPRQSVDEAIRAMVRSGAPGRGLVVADDGGSGTGGISEAISQAPAARRNASSLELLSDPKGVDFRPYLIQVLAAVKRNWQAVTPESARLGLQGRTAIQFSISKTGSVPKLVIAMPSGREPLDRAAVAGISASNPFPPLPAEFTGAEIRLQLVFSYNMPR